MGHRGEVSLIAQQAVEVLDHEGDEPRREPHQHREPPGQTAPRPAVDAHHDGNEHGQFVGMSPPHPRVLERKLLPHASHEFGLWRREVSWEGGLSHESQRSPVVSPPAACPPNACPRADPVGRLVSGEHVADAGDAAIFTAPHESSRGSRCPLQSDPCECRRVASAGLNIWEMTVRPGR